MLRPVSLFALLFALALPACQSPGKKKQKEEIRKPEGNLADQSQDPAFQAFLGRLRKAVARRDVKTLSTMMAADFGYSWEAGGEGPGVFAYWDRNRLWPEVNHLLKEKFVPSGNFMVAPKEVTTDPDYPGYRAGLRLVNGAWRFAYFVSAPPANAGGGQ